jgi:phage-related minor tail protein
MNLFFRLITLETGLIVGGALVLAGLAVSVAALSSWGARAFGELDPRQTLRMVVPGVAALTLGFQIVLSSFFLSVLGLSRRR